MGGGGAEKSPVSVFDWLLEEIPGGFERFGRFGGRDFVDGGENNPVGASNVLTAESFLLPGGVKRPERAEGALEGKAAGFEKRPEREPVDVLGVMAGGEKIPESDFEF